MQADKPKNPAKPLRIGLFLVSIYAAVLTGYVIGAAHSAVSWVTAPMALHMMAKDEQKRELGEG